MTTTKRTPTLDQAMDDNSDAWVFHDERIPVLVGEVRRLRSQEAELTRLRFAVMALIDKWREMAETYAKGRQESVANMADDAADALESALRSEP